jgi:Cof subfamily protein (haloacid dehalogenase superfamily)
VSERWLIAVDIDGTLVGESLQISHVDKVAIEAANASGDIICLASGRLFAASRPFAMELGLRAPVIALQGAAAYDGATGERLFCTPLQQAVALQAYDDLQARGFHLQLYYGDSLYLDALGDAARYYLKLSRVEPVMVPDLRALLTSPPPGERGPVKLLGVGSAELVSATIPILARKLGERANVFRSMPVFLEVTDPLATKGEALRKIAAMLRFDMSATAAVGDSDNDVSMFDVVRCSFAVANATSAAKQAASHVVSALGTGVADALNQLRERAAREPA